MAIALLNTYSMETIEVGIDFTSSAEECITIDIGKPLRTVVRGRLYIDEDPGAAFDAWATYTFYSKVAMLGPDAFYRTATKLVYTELEVATTGLDYNIQPDDHLDFSPNDLTLILDSTAGDEFCRLATVANIMTAEDIPEAHSIDSGLVRVSEFAGFELVNMESETNIYLCIGFTSAQTVSLKMEMVLRA